MIEDFLDHVDVHCIETRRHDAEEEGHRLHAL